MIKQSTIEKIKDIKIQDVLEKYIELKKNGANFIVSPSNTTSAILR